MADSGMQRSEMMTVLLVLTFGGILATVSGAVLCDRQYTTSNDFAEGDLVNLNYDIPNQLQLTNTRTQADFIWIPASAQGTIVKFDSAHGGPALGEYLSAPEGVYAYGVFAITECGSINVSLLTLST